MLNQENYSCFAISCSGISTLVRMSKSGKMGRLQAGHSTAAVAAYVTVGQSRPGTHV